MQNHPQSVDTNKTIINYAAHLEQSREVLLVMSNDENRTKEKVKQSNESEQVKDES